MKAFISMDQAWQDVITQLVDNGSIQPSRDGHSVELIGHSFRLKSIDKNLLICTGRNLSPIYAAAEFLWYMSGTARADMILHYAPQYKRFLERDGSAFGAYGYRWEMDDQLENLLTLLTTDPDSRQAVLTMYRANDLFRSRHMKPKDIPCTLGIQFLVRGSALHAIATMRSNDVWMGMPYDVFCFTTLQALLADELNVKAGEYVHNVGSLHLYGRHLERAKQARIIGPCSIGLPFSPSKLPFLQAAERATEWERGLRTTTTFDAGICKDIVKEFGFDSRWPMLLGLAWMQSLPPVDDDGLEGFKMMMPEVLALLGRQTRRKQKR